MRCISLKERFGNHYRVEYEESYHADHGPHARADDPWLMILPCGNGHICPWGDDLLAACTKKAGPVVARRLKKLPFTNIAQDGDDGANVLFHAKHFDAVAKIMRPRRRRQMSEKQRQRLVEAGRKFHFRPGAQNAESDPECDLGRGAA